MNYFLDTFGLGYVFCTNPWNDKSEHLFNKNPQDRTKCPDSKNMKNQNKHSKKIIPHHDNFGQRLSNDLESVGRILMLPSFQKVTVLFEKRKKIILSMI